MYFSSAINIWFTLDELLKYTMTKFPMTKYQNHNNSSCKQLVSMVYGLDDCWIYCFWNLAMRDRDVKKVQTDFRFSTLDFYSLMNHKLSNNNSLKSSFWFLKVKDHLRIGVKSYDVYNLIQPSNIHKPQFWATIEMKNFFPFLFFRLSSNPVTRDDLIESTLAK